MPWNYGHFGILIRVKPNLLVQSCANRLHQEGPRHGQSKGQILSAVPRRQGHRLRAPRGVVGVLPGRGRTGRRKVADSRDEAEQVAARSTRSSQANEPTLLTFTPIGVAELRKQFSTTTSTSCTPRSIRSGVTARRPSTSKTFVRTLPKLPQAHEVRVEAFAAYLRRFGWPRMGTRTPRSGSCSPRACSTCWRPARSMHEGGQVDQGDQHGSRVNFATI